MLFKDLPIFNYDDDTAVTVSHNGADYLEIEIDDIKKHFMNIEVETFNIDDFEDEVFIEVRVSEIDFDKMKDILPQCYFGQKGVENEYRY